MNESLRKGDFENEAEDDPKAGPRERSQERSKARAQKWDQACIQKLFKIGENLALTTAGLVGHAQSLARTLASPSDIRRGGAAALPVARRELRDLTREGAVAASMGS